MHELAASVHSVTDPAVTSITVGERSGRVASAELLGVNLEMAGWVNEAMLSDRLLNAKFCGPVNAQTGLAPDWQPIGNNMGNVQMQLVSGMFLSGGESQLVNHYAGSGGSAGFLQTGVYLREGEELEIEMWAKVRHHPVTIEIHLAPAPSRATAYCTASISIDASYWKKYTARVLCPCDDANATFYLFFMETGVVLFDQIHLRPVNSPHLHEEIIDHMAEMCIPVLRFPGGCTSTNYHWKLGTGPHHLRPSLLDPVFKQRTGYDFGTNEYLTACQEQGIRPYITVNIGSGTPEDAGGWARYCAEWYRERGLHRPAIYFQMGNEQYGAWETSHMTAPMYLEALKEFVPEIRENYPEAVIIALAEPECGGIAGLPSTKLRELVLEKAEGLVDVLAINRYKGQWFDDPLDKIVNVVESADKIEADFLQLVEDCQRHGWKPRLALAEWNYWLHAAHWDGKGFDEPDDALHALFVSGMFHMMARLAPYIELAAIEQLVNAMGLIQNRRGQVSVTAINEIFRLYRPAFPGEIVELEIDCGELREGIPQVDALAVLREDALWIFICNRSLTSPASLQIEAKNFRLGGRRLFVAENWHSPVGERHFDEDMVLPPLSLARLCFEPQAD